MSTAYRSSICGFYPLWFPHRMSFSSGLAIIAVFKRSRYWKEKRANPSNWFSVLTSREVSLVAPIYIDDPLTSDLKSWSRETMATRHSRSIAVSLDSYLTWSKTRTNAALTISDESINCTATSIVAEAKRTLSTITSSCRVIFFVTKWKIDCCHEVRIRNFSFFWLCTKVSRI